MIPAGRFGPLARAGEGEMMAVHQGASIACPTVGLREKQSTADWRKWLVLILPILSIGVTAAVEAGVARSLQQNKVPHPYFLYFLGIALIAYVIALVASVRLPHLRQHLLVEAPFYTMLAQLLDGVNLLTAKFAVLPVIYFPAPDRVIGAMVKDFNLLLSCIAYSYSLLAISWILGVSIGVANGAWMGFNKRAEYWLWPFIKALGPIPPVAWIPIVLVLFPNMYSGSVFLIFLAVWFPTASLTLSGIHNIRNSYFEVAETLGASRRYQIWKIAIPAAMPDIFMGIFTGTCMSFIVLLTAEMIGAKYGLGWYVNWQKEMMSYANVYAGLILIATSFCLFMAVLFRIKNHILAWQKGVIKW